MANVRLLYNYDAWDAGSISESSDIAKRRGGNILLDQPGKSWVTTGDTGQWIVNDLGTNKKLTCFGIFNHNLSSTATITLEGNALDIWTSPTYSQALTIATNADGTVFPRLVYFLDETHRFFRLTIEDGSNPDGRIEIGRIIAGEYYEFTRQPARGLRVAHADPSSIEHTGGTIENFDDLEERNRYRQFRVDLPWRDVTERRKIEAIYTKVGNVRPVVLALDPTNYPSEMSAYCYVISDLDYSWNHSSRFDVQTMLFEEKTR
jgi:hypothetical protein